MGDDHYDVAVIGGGVSGIGVCAELLQRGYRVILLEKEPELLTKASANSLRIIHGGLRYLQHLNLPRILESVTDQARLLREFPDVIRPLPCLMPLKKTGTRSKWPVSAALYAYKLLQRGLVGQNQPAKILTSEQAEACNVRLRGLVPHGAMLWTDALIMDWDRFARLLTSELTKACVMSGVEVRSLNVKSNAVEIIADGLHIEAQVVVNTTGADLEGLRPENFVASHPRGWAKAFNLVIDRKLVDEYAFGLYSKSGRLFFFVPRGEGTAIGTWYQAIDQRSIPENDDAVIDLFCREINQALPSAELTAGEVRQVETGILPMSGQTETEPILYGAERILISGRYVDVLSTKLTTFRSQAVKVAKCVGGII